MADFNWYGNTSGRGRSEGIPPGIKDRWNWGAFLLGSFWALAHKKYMLAFLGFIPGISFVVVIMLGYKGNEWAWQNVEWKDIDHFQQTQKTWAWVGASFWLIFSAWRMLPLVIQILKH